MTAMHERDEWLMAQVAFGKRDFLEPLIRRYASPLLTFIQRMVGDPHKSEDVFQEVFLAVWAKRHQYQFPRPFKAWLYTIAANQCHAQARKRPLALAPFSEDGTGSAAASPADTAIATETAALVAAAVAQLPTQQRAVVAMRVWNGLSYAEIADALDRTEATVRSHMHHGLTAMRRYLEPRLSQHE